MSDAKRVGFVRHAKPAPPPKVVQPQTMTEAEWLELGNKLFGSKESQWRFCCPHCGNVMSGQKAHEMSADELARLRDRKWDPSTECIGRHITGGCDWCAYGLFSGPFFVVRSDGHRTPVFGFDTAETPSSTPATEGT